MNNLKKAVSNLILAVDELKLIQQKRSKYYASKSTSWKESIQGSLYRLETLEYEQAINKIKDIINQINIL